MVLAASPLAHGTYGTGAACSIMATTAISGEGQVVDGILLLRTIQFGYFL
jgi:hypothetical protein